MNYQETNNITQQATKKVSQRRIFSNNWEGACRELSGLALSKKDIDSATAKADEESFLAHSALLPELIDKVNLDELSLAELVFLSQAASAIEFGNTKAAVFVRDTSGGKPVDKTVSATTKISDLTDEQLDFVLENCEVIDGTDS